MKKRMMVVVDYLLLSLHNHSIHHNPYRSIWAGYAIFLAMDVALECSGLFIYYSYECGKDFTVFYPAVIAGDDSIFHKSACMAQVDDIISCGFLCDKLHKSPF